MSETGEQKSCVQPEVGRLFSIAHCAGRDNLPNQKGGLNTQAMRRIVGVRARNSLN